MIVPFIRSSSYTAFDMCQQRYFLEYCVGIKPPSGRKAVLGSIVHKGLELLARKKLSQQNSELDFFDEELARRFPVSITPDQAIEDSHAFYTSKESHHTWKPADFKQVRKWMWDALLLDDGLWNPLNRRVVAPEIYFDLTIEQPWATYDFLLPNGEKLQGQLAIKGTMDLVTEIGNGVWELVDWKTGKRLDWATGQVKDWAKLRKDPQLRLYHYALSRLFPKVKNIVVSIVYIQDGGAFSMPFGPEDLVATEQMLKRRFEAIKNTVRPKLKKSWHCTRFCHHGMNNYIDANGNDTGRTVCEHFRDEVVQIGLDGVMKKHADVKALTSYGSGGGQTNRDAKEAE